MSGDFDDILTANKQFASDFGAGGFDGIAHAGLAIVTCMDSRIDPLGMVGIKAGDAKILRNPGGQVTPESLEGLVLAAHLLNVDRIMIVPHTRCAMSSSSEEQFQQKVSASAGSDASWHTFHVVEDQRETLADDVRKVRTHPLIPDSVKVGGFIYDVDTGLLEQVV